MPHYNVLFLCTGNSARSIMAETIMNRKGGANFTAYSAGSHPTGTVRPEAVRQLERAALDATNARSKSWDEFTTADAPHLSFVFTVCDKAAAEVCPLWPGQPMTAHWGIPDPAAVQGTEQEIDRAYGQALQALDRRISLFCACHLPPSTASLSKSRSTKSGRTEGASMQKVIFACVHNAGRSQMAAAFFNQFADHTKAEAVSAGTEPGQRVHPEVLTVMQEVGIDVSQAKPQKLTQELAEGASLLITMGCRDKCPYVPGLRRDDWPLKDPKGLPIEEVRLIRDDIKNRVQALLSNEGCAG